MRGGGGGAWCVVVVVVAAVGSTCAPVPAPEHVQLCLSTCNWHARANAHTVLTSYFGAPFLPLSSELFFLLTFEDTSYCVFVRVHVRVHVYVRVHVACACVC